jgi:hypothetical protein
MRTYISNTQTLLPAFLLLFGAFLTSTLAFAQSENEPAVSRTIVTSSKESKLKKTINIDDIDGEKVVVVTTVKDGVTTYETYEGEAAEEYIENSAELMIEEATESGFSFETKSSDNTELKVIMMKCDSGSANGEQVIWMSESDENEYEIALDGESINVTNENGVMTLDVNYTNEDGDKMTKVMVFNETEIVNSMEEMEAMLEDMNIEININIDGEDADGKKVKTVIVTKKIVIEESEDSSDMEDSMFSEFSVSPNPSNGELKIKFEPINKGKIVVTVLDIKGNVLFTDSYNGKSSYSKNINIENYKGVVMLKVEQGENVEVRKLIIE